MRSKLTTVLTVSVSLAVIALVIGNLRWTNSSFANVGAQEKKQRNVKQEVLNTVIDAAPDEIDAEKKAARREKNKRFNKKSANTLLGQGDGEYSGTLLESEPPPLPITSDLIIVGSIQRRQPYVSDNMSCVYTELTVHIEEILKNNPFTLAYTFEPLTVNRDGGAIRMPNGRIFGYLVAGLGIPEVGRRYVLFLQEKKRDYIIVSGYEMTDKTIMPLEDFGDRESLLDLSEAQFLDLVNQRILKSKPGTSDD